jgi:hypothetical protein
MPAPGSAAAGGRRRARGSPSQASIMTADPDMSIRDLSSLLALVVGMLLVLAA